MGDGQSKQHTRWSHGRLQWRRVCEHGPKTIDGPPELFMNTCNAHNWVSITLEDLVGDRSAIGSKLELKTDNHHQKRWILAGGTSFLSSSPTTAYFGLNEDNRIIELSIEWPDGSETLLTDLNVNHHITIQRSHQ